MMPVTRSYRTSDYGHYLGDVRVWGHYTGFSPDMSTGFLFGLKLPTGSTNVKFRSGPDQGELVDPTLQPGRAPRMNSWARITSMTSVR